MTLRNSLHNYVRDVVDVGVHDARLPIRPMMPAIVLKFITAVSTLTHSNPRSLLPRRVQFTCYADNDGEVDTIATNLLRALDGYHGPMGDVSIGWAQLLNDVELDPQEGKGDGKVRYRRVLDFEVAYQEVRMTPVPVTSS